MTMMDSEDEFKRKMRRRLVGAVALVTALVVILPMLLENSPKPQGGNLELRIPDKDKSGAFTSQMVVAESAPDVTPLPPAGAEAPAASAPAAPAPHAVEKPAAAVAPQAAQKPEHGKGANAPAAVAKGAGAKAGAKPETAKADAHKVAQHKAGFAVQVGAFSRAAAAKELQDRLKQRGWHAYTQKAGETVRVRVGPYSTRADAETQQRKLAAQGVHPAAVVAEP